MKLLCHSIIVEIHATSQIHNSLRELVNGLIDIVRGDLNVRVSWATTAVKGELFPTSFQFFYVPFLHEEGGKLTIWKFANHRWGEDASVSLALEGTVDEIVLPFWRALQQLQSARPIHKFSAAWGFPFPVEQMSTLTKLIEQRQKNGSLP